MCPNEPNFIILRCLMPNNFTLKNHINTLKFKPEYPLINPLKWQYSPPKE